MNTKRTFLVFAGALISCAAFAWGVTGHSTVASLAELNMKKSTVKQVEAYLGRSAAFYASWPDEWREHPDYSFSSSCHGFPVDEALKYAPKEGTLDAVSLLEQAIAVVKDRKNQTDSAVVVNLKFIIHLVGDMHCPGHVKYKNINRSFKVYAYPGDKAMVSYHSVWDSQIIERRRASLSPRELAADLNRLSKDEIKAVQSGSIVDWAQENAAGSVSIYDGVSKGSQLTKAFYNEHWPYVQQQLTRAGYRLAKVLEECFAK